jgi:dihydroneopterin aldolase
MPHEAKVGQSFTLDLDLEIDLSAAARSDKVVDTVSYDKVVDCVADAFCAQRFRLIEAAAGRVADAVLAAFHLVRSVRVTIHKPHAPIAATFNDVGVTLVRSRHG